jgi:hypothetical protein
MGAIFEKKFVVTEGSKEYIAYVKYEQYRGNKEPHFSITCDYKENGRLESCGCQHDLVKKKFPELAPYLIWHLASPSGPMYYIENSLYFFKMYLGLVSQDKYARYEPLEAFKNNICFGNIRRDVSKFENLMPYDLDSLTPENKETLVLDIKNWLDERLPEIQRQFKEDMEEVKAL